MYRTFVKTDGVNHSIIKNKFNTSFEMYFDSIFTNNYQIKFNSDLIKEILRQNQNIDLDTLITFRGKVNRIGLDLYNPFFQKTELDLQRVNQKRLNNQVDNDIFLFYHKKVHQYHDALFSYNEILNDLIQNYEYSDYVQSLIKPSQLNTSELYNHIVHVYNGRIKKLQKTTLSAGIKFEDNDDKIINHTYFIEFNPFQFNVNGIIGYISGYKYVHINDMNTNLFKNNLPNLMSKDYQIKKNHNYLEQIPVEECYTIIYLEIKRVFKNETVLPVNGSNDTENYSFNNSYRLRESLRYHIVHLPIEYQMINDLIDKKIDREAQINIFNRLIETKYLKQIDEDKYNPNDLYPDKLVTYFIYNEDYQFKPVSDKTFKCKLSLPLDNRNMYYQTGTGSMQDVNILNTIDGFIYMLPLMITHEKEEKFEESQWIYPKIYINGKMMNKWSEDYVVNYE